MLKSQRVEDNVRGIQSLKLQNNINFSHLLTAQPHTLLPAPHT